MVLLLNSFAFLFLICVVCNVSIGCAGSEHYWSNFVYKQNGLTMEHFHNKGMICGMFLRQPFDDYCVLTDPRLLKILIFEGKELNIWE